MQITKWTPSKVAVLFGHFYFWCFLLGSLVFYKERLCNFDSAIYTLDILHFDEFVIWHHRFINYLTQWVPMAAKNLGMGLKPILMSYSFSLVLVLYLIYNFLVHGLKSIWGGMYLVLVFGLTFRFKFYTGISEITQSMAIAVFYLVWVSEKTVFNRPREMWFNLLITIFLASLMAVAHPIVVIPIAGVMGFYLWYDHRWSDRHFWAQAGVSALVFLLKFWQIHDGSYEAKKVSRLSSYLDVLGNYQDYYVFKIIAWYFQTEYWLAILLFVLGLAYLLKQKKIRSALWLVLWTLLLLVLIAVTLSYLAFDCYVIIDGYMTMLGFLFGLPFVYVIFRNQMKWWTLGLLVFTGAFNLFQIYDSHTFFTRRVQYMEETIQANRRSDARIFILKMEAFSWDKLWYPYQLYSESILLSSLENPDSTTILWVDQHDKVDLDSINLVSYDQRTHIMYPLNRVNPIEFPPGLFHIPMVENTKVEQIRDPAWMKDD